MAVLCCSESEWFPCSCIRSHWWCMFFPFQGVSEILGELHLWAANNTCPWLSSLYVASVKIWIQTLLMMPVVCFLGSELRLVSYICTLLMMPIFGSPVGECLTFWSSFVHDNCAWLSRRWVASMMYYIWSLQIIHALGSLVCEWFVLWAVFGPCWWHLSFTPQFVSGLLGRLPFDLADDGCSASELFSGQLHLKPTHDLSFPLQKVSGFHGKPHLDPADYSCPCLPRKWVASIMSCILTLLTTPLLGSPGS